MFCYNISSSTCDRRRIPRCLGAYLDVRAHRVCRKIRTRFSGYVMYMYHRHGSEWVLCSIYLWNLFLDCFFIDFLFILNISPFKIMKSVFFDKGYYISSFYFYNFYLFYSFICYLFIYLIIFMLVFYYLLFFIGLITFNLEFLTNKLPWITLYWKRYKILS